MARRGLVIAAALLVALLVCLPRAAVEADEETMTVADSALFRLVAAGVNLGYLEPCGCTDGMLGGLPRRAAWLARLAEEGVPVVLLDNGDWTGGVDALQEYKLRAFSRTFAELGRHIGRPGLRDLPVGAEALTGYARPNVELVSADLVCALWPAFVDVEVAGKILRVTSLSDPERALEFGASLGGEVLPPAEALAAVRAELPEGALLVILYGGDGEAAREHLAEAGAALIITAAEGDVAPFTETLPGGTLLVGVGTRGRYLQELGFLPGQGLRHLARVGLSGRIPDLPSVRRILEDYEGELVRDNLASALAAQTAVQGGEYVGSETCRSCHVEAYMIWQDTRHAHSLPTLEERGRAGNPECLACHTVGYGYVSGFESREETPGLAAVGCESCHGVGSEHVMNPSLRMGLVGEAGCVGCHDPINSPEFDFRKYWKKIAHGR